MRQHTELFHRYVRGASLEHPVHKTVDVILERIALADYKDCLGKLAQYLVLGVDGRAQVLALLHLSIVEHALWSVAAYREIQELRRKNVVVQRQQQRWPKLLITAVDCRVYQQKTIRFSEVSLNSHDCCGENQVATSRIAAENYVLRLKSQVLATIAYEPIVRLPHVVNLTRIPCSWCQTVINHSNHGIWILFGPYTTLFLIGTRGHGNESAAMEEEYERVLLHAVHFLRLESNLRVRVIVKWLIGIILTHNFDLVQFAAVLKLCPILELWQMLQIF